MWTSQTITELKIHLRERRPGIPIPWEEESDWPEAEGIEGMGKNDMTVRYVWDDEI
jgi:CTD kinase subunit beta